MKNLTQGSVTKHLLHMSAFLAASMLVQTLHLLSDPRARPRRDPSRGQLGADRPAPPGSVCVLFEETMRISNTSSGFLASQPIEQFHEAGLVRIAHRGSTIWLDPFGMLNAEIFVNLPLELLVSVDFMRRSRQFDERFAR